MRRIFTFFLTFLLGMFVTALYAQTHTVSGTVIDKDANEPLIGANVLIKGTTIGTVTDLDGKYTLQAGDKDILVFSYLSMKTIEEPVNGRTVINVKMASDTETLGEVVVTAMGIKRQSETLTYSAQTVGGKDVNDIKSVNMINSLQGKSAGMMITPNSTGAGGSSKILFRGNKSISGNNQPLVVVDGVPVMMNITNSQVDPCSPTTYGKHFPVSVAKSCTDGFCVRCVKIVHQRALYGFLFGDACFEALFYQMGQ